MKADFGMIGLAVMGENLALNIEEHGSTVAVWNLEREKVDQFTSAHRGKRFVGETELTELVRALERPRRIMMMIKAGKPVDMTLEALRPLLDQGDVVIDGGNSWFEDTQRRTAEMARSGIHFIGSGVSGGEEGARHGPSLMPGGDPGAYETIRPVFEAIAAKTESGPCVTHVGPDGAGHFVKMVHNGIEYGDMQLIAEAYEILRVVAGLDPGRLADIFGDWNRGPLESFLIEITAKIFTVRDPKSGEFLIDQVLDKAGQKGTGKWTAQVALDLAVPIPTIAAAIDARVLSSMKEERVSASRVLAGPPSSGSIEIGDVHDALYAAKICAYAQGMSLIGAGSREHNWSIDLREMARIWKGGCIIRARFLDSIMRAYERRPELANLLLDPTFAKSIEKTQGAWRRTVSIAQNAGVAVPAMSASLAYFDAYRSARLPQNLTQAQRDFFGSHTYQRVDDPDGPFVHTEWSDKVVS
jgi:6-phosphogluconate dehydrogenase